MIRNNKKRLLVLLGILKKKTNIDKHLNAVELTSLLEEEGIEVSNRKTLYDDLKILSDAGYDIECDDGYYLLEAPFSLSEIKIIQDSINSLKNLDKKFLDGLNNKLYSFISEDEEKLLEELKYTSKHNDKKLIQHMELILEAINKHTALSVKTRYRTDEVFPLFLHRENDYYYVYYHYENSDKLYHYRLDNISSISFLDKLDEISISKKKIIDTINASSNSFFKGEMKSVSLKVLKENEYLDRRISDDFKDVIKTKDGYSIRVNVNDIFFSKILTYGDQIKISDENTAYEYVEYLKKIQNLYLPPK
ncbi:MAG: WYL domain-containing protein [Erysipelotrichaceae bacterium]|nr:WYL domain-containing protein [Erysipelotrichaceae bacterium]